MMIPACLQGGVRSRVTLGDGAHEKGLVILEGGLVPLADVEGDGVGSLWVGGVWLQGFKHV